MSTYNDVGVRCDSQAQNRVIDQVVGYATYLDSSMPTAPSLSMIHKRMHILWEQFSRPWEWQNIRPGSSWIWKDLTWQRRETIDAHEMIRP